jgi:hypothetical protein
MTKKFNLLLDRFLINITNWVIANKYRIVGFIALVIFTISFSFLPYLNLVFTNSLVLFLIISLFFIIFRISWKIIIYISIILLIMSFVLTITGFTPMATVLGDFTYGFLIIVALEYFLTI